MADQANVYVKNSLSGSIDMCREQPDGSQDTYTLAAGGQEMIFLASSQVKLFIDAPNEGDMGIPIGFKSSGGVFWSCSTANRRWTIRPEATTTNPDTPTTVNVNIGDEDV